MSLPVVDLHYSLDPCDFEEKGTASLTASAVFVLHVCRSHSVYWLDTTQGSNRLWCIAPAFSSSSRLYQPTLKSHWLCSQTFLSSALLPFQSLTHPARFVQALLVEAPATHHTTPWRPVGPIQPFVRILLIRSISQSFGLGNIIWQNILKLVKLKQFWIYTSFNTNKPELAKHLKHNKNDFVLFYFMNLGCFSCLGHCNNILR